MGLLHFAFGYEPPGRLWDPPAGEGEEIIPVGAACFPSHVHGSGIFSMRLQPQLNGAWEE